MKKTIITNQEILDKLTEIKKCGESKQESTRSHAILLLNKGKSKNEVAEIFDVTNRAVYYWIQEWEKRGIDSVYRRKGDGRKPLLTEKSHKGIIQKNIDNYPHQPKKAYALTLKEIDIEVSYKTFKRFLKKYLD